MEKQESFNNGMAMMAAMNDISNEVYGMNLTYSNDAEAEMAYDALVAYVYNFADPIAPIRDWGWADFDIDSAA